MKPTNLVFLLARNLDWAMPGINGNCLSYTDAIDALGEESVRITCALSGEPEGKACRAAVLGGGYRAEILPPEETVFARCLSAAGYGVNFSGSWNRTGHAPLSPDSQTDALLDTLDALSRSGAPFALFCDFDAPGDGSSPELVSGDDLDPFRERWFRPAPSFALNDRSVPRSTRLTASRLGEENERRKLRYAMLTALDRCVERILSRVEESALSRDTLIVFTSDGGLLFGDHGRIGGGTFYEEAVRTPLFLRRTMVLSPGEAELCISSADLCPTILALLNLPVPEEMTGRSFAPAILDGKTDDTPAVITGKGYAALRGRHYKLCRDLKRKKTMLFDLRTDPYELNDLAENETFAALRAEMEEALNARLSALPPAKKRR